ncbi:MAG: alpha/beta hydrolase [Anaerolineae bacterium]|nr:alpha/beta hydrolase [Anaerolineae bacterium]
MRRLKRVLKIVLIVLGVLLVLVIIVPLLIPIPPLEDTVPPEKLADPDSRFIVVNGIKVHYKMLGQGEPKFVLMHGFAASVFSWREVMRPFAERGTVMAYDRPAFGLTARPMPGEWSGTNPYSIDAQVDLAIGMMDTLGMPRAILVGNSAGGTVAALTALRHPTRVRALILVSPAIFIGGGSAPWYQPLMTTPQGRRIGQLVARQIRNWGIEFAKSAWHDPSKLTPEIWEGYAKPLRAENWDRALWEFTAASRPTDLRQRLSELTMPTLVITGDDDRIVPTEQSVRLARQLPNAQLVVIPSCGHIPQEECPEAFMRAVNEFLNRLP